MYGIWFSTVAKLVRVKHHASRIRIHLPLFPHPSFMVPIVWLSSTVQVLVSIYGGEAGSSRMSATIAIFVPQPTKINIMLKLFPIVLQYNQSCSRSNLKICIDVRSIIVDLSEPHTWISVQERPWSKTIAAQLNWIHAQSIIEFIQTPKFTPTKPP